jgi:hypothetical protein
MLTSLSVETGIWKPQALYRFSSNDVRLDDFVYIGGRHAPVPDGFWIDDQVGPVLTLIEASGLIGPDLSFQSAFGQLLLEKFLQFSFGLGIAASSRMSRRPLVPADEDMLLKLWHDENVSGKEIGAKIRQAICIR